MIGVWGVKILTAKGPIWLTALHPVPGDGAAEREAVIAATTIHNGHIKPLDAVWERNGYSTTEIHKTLVLGGAS